MDNVDWNDIRLLLAVEQGGSLSAAAQVLRIDQATVSRRLQRLEQLACTPLFRRAKTGTLPTDAGRRLLERATDVQRTVEDFGRTLHGLSRVDPQRVVIKASEGVASYLLTPLVMGHRVGPMREILPKMDSDFGFPTPPRIISDQTPGHADITLHWTTPDGTLSLAPDAKVRKLASVRFAAVTAHSYGVRKGGLPERFDDIEEHDLLTVSVYDQFGSDASFGPWNALTQDNPRCLKVDWTSSVERSLGSGCGITLLPTYAPLFSDDFIVLDMPTPTMHLDLWLAADPESLRDSHVRRTYELIHKAFGAFAWC